MPDFSGEQVKASGVARHAKLESEPKTIVVATTGADASQVVIRKGVVAQHRRFIGSQVTNR